MSKHTISATRSGSFNGMDWDADYVITFSYVAGAALIMHPVDNADPGWPAEVEFVSIEPGADDVGAFTDLAQKDLEDWAQGWLDDHYDECVSLAEEDSQPDPDAARDARIDDELCGVPRYDDGDW